MEKLEQYVPTGPNDNTVRILRAFIDHLPEDGRADLIHHLQSLGSNPNQEIHDYAESLVNGLLMPMWNLRPRYEGSIRYLIANPDGPPAREVRLKKDCLDRDSLRCVVTGFYDEDSRRDKNITGPGIRAAYTNCTPIFPFALTTWKDEHEKRAKDIVWSNLTRYFPSIENQLHFTRKSINDTRNAMTMSLNLHLSFGSFDFAFEETSRRYTYTLKNYKPWVLDDLPEQVTFTCHNSESPFALPSSGLLKVHAALANIFHASGAARSIEKAVQNLEDIEILARDGSTDLSAALAASSVGILGSRAQWLPSTPGTAHDNDTSETA